MTAFLKRFPFHPWLIALYPVTALLAHNVTEVDPSAALRPLALSLALATLLFLACWLLTRSAARAALYTSTLLVLFFSYGHIYELLHATVGNPLIGRHRYLAPLYLGLLVLAIWVVHRARDTAIATQALNLVALVLLALPLFSLANYYRTAGADTDQVRAASSGNSLTYEGKAGPPDVYFIMLDTYMRGDALQRDMHFDNSGFLNALESMGFYVARCSRSNYEHTEPSLISTFNMDYIPNLQKELEAEGISDPAALWTLLFNGSVLRTFESMGYRTVSFATTFKWSENENADVYLAPGRNSERVQALLPFEAMFLKSTAAVILTDSDAKFFNRAANVVNFPWDYHVNTELYVLDTLSKLARMPGPKFVFVHILIPHVPYVFEPDGTVRVDPNYYSSPGADAVNQAYRRAGYVDSVQFINSRMLPILKTLIDESPTPPIIVMEGDHGLQGHNRTENLSTYFLPGVDNKGLYPSITPVNSFRVIFNDYFGAHYSLLPDQSYSSFKLGHTGVLTPEFEPECQP